MKPSRIIYPTTDAQLIHVNVFQMKIQQTVEIEAHLFERLFLSKSAFMCRDKSRYH